MDLQRGDRLTDLVVQFVRDALALGILRLHAAPAGIDQLPEQFLFLQRRAVQFVLA